MAIMRRHKQDQATFEELDRMGQVRSQNGTTRTLLRMTVAHGRRVGLAHSKKAMLQRIAKLVEEIERL